MSLRSIQDQCAVEYEAWGEPFPNPYPTYCGDSFDMVEVISQIALALGKLMARKHRRAA